MNAAKSSFGQGLIPLREAGRRLQHPIYAEFASIHSPSVSEVSEPLMSVPTGSKDIDLSEPVKRDIALPVGSRGGPST